MMAGAELGATLGALGGPVGVAVGTVVGGLLGGLFGGLAGNWVGEQSKALVTEQRAKAAEPEVFMAIDRYLRQTAAALDRLADEFCNQLHEQLDGWREAEMAVHEAQRQTSMLTLAQSDGERSVAAEALQADLATLTHLQARCREVAA
jgi:hypothetical protein